jgi:beta-lactam-binding protein with PASTA domain
VAGLTLRKAKARVRSRHCSVGRVTKRFSTLKKKGKVLSQAPKPGKRLRNGARVSMVIGKGPRRR